MVELRGVAQSGRRYEPERMVVDISIYMDRRPPGNSYRFALVKASAWIQSCGLRRTVTEPSPQVRPFIVQPEHRANRHRRQRVHHAGHPRERLHQRQAIFRIPIIFNGSGNPGIAAVCGNVAAGSPAPAPSP